MHRRRSSHVSPEIEPCDGKRAQDGKGTYSGIQQLPTVGNIPAHRIGTYSSHGLKPGHNGEPFAKINQDRGLITYPFDDDPRMALLVVLDGHGSNGEQVSEFVMWKLQEQLLAEPTKLRDENLVSAHFTKAFEETDRLLAESSVSAKVSGTTCVACLVVGQTLWVANTGDSRAVMATSSPDGKLSITPLSYDQKPDDPQEEARIRSYGGCVTPCSEQLGPARVWIKQGEGPGLAMARSIGDHMCSTVGVVATPEVLRFNLEPDVEYRVLMASDGVWEFLENEDAMPYLFQHDTASDACVALIDEASRQWHEAEDNYRDDITALVCHFPLFPSDGKLDGSPTGSFTTHKVEPAAAANGAEAAAKGTSPPTVPATATASASAMPPSKFEKRRLTVSNAMHEDAVTDEKMAALRDKYDKK